MAEEPELGESFEQEDEPEREETSVTETSKPPDYPRDYYVKEFDALRREVDWTMKDSRLVERNVIVAIGIFWGFLLKEKDIHLAPEVRHAAWCVPVLFAVVGGLRSLAISLKLNLIGSYVDTIEKYMRKKSEPDGSPVGWETFQKGKTRWITASACGLWIVLIVVTVVGVCINWKQ